MSDWDELKKQKLDALAEALSNDPFWKQHVDFEKNFSKLSPLEQFELLKRTSENHKSALERLAVFANVSHSVKPETSAEEIATWIEQSFESTVESLKKRVTELETGHEWSANAEKTCGALRRQVDALQADNTRLVEERRAVDETYMVEHFHRVCDLPVLEKPAVPWDDRVRLRLRLIAEEFKELLDSCLAFDSEDEFVFANRFLSAWPSVEAAIDKCVIDVDLPEFADACADLKYVIVGSELEFGIDGRPVFAGVHEANLKKADGPVREDGKRLKGSDWKPFDVTQALRDQGWPGK